MRLLNRLHVCFLDQRTLLQDSASSYILETYVRKAGILCHPEFFGPTPPEFGEGRKPEHPIRIDAKRVSPNHTVMRIESCFSTVSGEWSMVPEGKSVERRKTLYLLSDEHSIATRVFRNRSPVFEREYQSPKLNAIRLFSDTQRHISAPIVGGGNECLGILTIETVDRDAYSDDVKAAFALLAAHASWPLGRAIKREDFEAKQKEVGRVGEVKARYREQNAEEGVIKMLILGLQYLQYQRGLFCRVNYLTPDYREFAVDGERAWDYPPGTTEMQDLMERTHRHHERDADDCQIKAVREKRHQTILNPDRHPSVHKEVQEVARLNPFAIFPLRDSRERVVWTVHIERHDTSPIGIPDENLVKELCENAMKARDEARQAGFELEWIERLLSTGFSSRKRLFRAFADFICGVRRGEDGEESGDEAKAVVSRCRVFLIDDSGAQIGYYQAGKHQIVDFPFPLGDDDEPLFNSMKEKLRPILAYVTGTSRKLKSGDEFSTRKMPVDYPQKDRVGDRTQWLELPVVVGRRVVAKIVVDHFSEPNDAFTLGEVRHLSRLVRSLSLAAETVELQRDRFNLSLVGQQYRFLWHHQFSTWDRLYFFAANNPSASRVEFQNRLEEIRKAQERLEAVFNTSSQQGGDPVSVDDDLTLAEEIMGPQITTKAPPKFPANKVNAEYPSSHRPLLQILLTLLANADNACQNESENYSTPASITVEAERVDGKLVISVEDTGCGVADKADQIREAFLEPASFLHEGLDGRKGLVYSAYLAQDLGWELHLASEHGPTRFELSLPVKGKVGAGGST